MHQPVFTDVKVAGAGAAAPLVRFAFGDAVLEPVQARVIPVSKSLDLLKNTLLFFGERFQRPVVIVYDANRG